MSIIPNKPIYGNQNLHNIANNFDPPFGVSPHRYDSFYEKVPEIEKGSEQAGGGIRSFNKKLAFDLQRKLKSKKPDITGAFVLGTLQTWKNARRHAQMGNRVPGAVYQSVEGICEDLPWLDRSSVHRAIQRLEQAFPEYFSVDRSSTKVLNFEISDKLTRLYFAKDRSSKDRGSVELSLYISDAEKYGVLKALLIRNLEYKTREDKVSNPLKDDLGRIFGEMSSSRLTREKSSLNESPSAPILPFGRQSVNKAIRSLVSVGVFVEHMERRGFYRVEREELKEETSEKPHQNRLSSNATVVSPNATVLSSNATNLSPNATVYSGQIVRDRNGDRNEMESDREVTELSPEAQPVPFSKFNGTDLEASKEFDLRPSIIKPPVALIECSAACSIQKIPVPVNSETSVRLPRFFEDEFPDLMREVNENVQRSRNARKTPPEPIHPDLTALRSHCRP